MSDIRVGIFGSNGKMGVEVVRAVNRAEGMTAVAGVDLGDPLESVGRAQVVVDFTTPEAVMDHIEWCLSRGIHMVIGTTGFTPERLDRVRELCAANPGVGVLIAPNFSIGAVLMMRFAEAAARFYASAEVVELHHPGKLDAPSGTARLTAERIAKGRELAELGPVPDATVADDGARGAVVGGIHIHAVRLQGLVAHQQVLFGAEGETLTLQHDSYDRACFMPGVLAGIRHVVAAPGLTIGIEELLQL